MSANTPEWIRRLHDEAMKAEADAYERGYRAGLAAGMLEMANRVNAALRTAEAEVNASAPTNGATDNPAPIYNKLFQHVEAGAEDGRAPKGTVNRAIVVALLTCGPQGTAELKEIATSIDPRVSPKSVENELSRRKDKLYRQIEGQWWFVGKADPYLGMNAKGRAFTSMHKAHSQPLGQIGDRLRADASAFVIEFMKLPGEDGANSREILDTVFGELSQIHDTNLERLRGFAAESKKGPT